MPRKDAGYNVRMRLPRRLWLRAVFLLAVVVTVAWLFVPRSRITQENFELIQGGMSEEQVIVILGDAEHNYGSLPKDIPKWLGSRLRLWRDGPNWIVVFFDEDGKVIDDYKHIHFATVWETLEWYAKKGAEKIGVKWTDGHQYAMPPTTSSLNHLPNLNLDPNLTLLLLAD